MALRRAGAIASLHSWQTPYAPSRRRSSASARRLARSTSRLRVAKFISRSSLIWITSTSSASWLVSPSAFMVCTDVVVPPIWRMRSTVRVSSPSRFFFMYLDPVDLVRELARVAQRVHGLHGRGRPAHLADALDRPVQFPFQVLLHVFHFGLPLGGSTPGPAARLAWLSASPMPLPSW